MRGEDGCGVEQRGHRRVTEHGTEEQSEVRGGGARYAWQVVEVTTEAQGEEEGEGEAAEAEERKGDMAKVVARAEGPAHSSYPVFEVISVLSPLPPDVLDGRRRRDDMCVLIGTPDGACDVLPATSQRKSEVIANIRHGGIFTRSIVEHLKDDKRKKSVTRALHRAIHGF
eukprot:768804-Hanusia_phi.AAC.3